MERLARARPELCWLGMGRRWRSPGFGGGGRVGVVGRDGRRRAYSTLRPDRPSSVSTRASEFTGREKIEYARQMEQQRLVELAEKRRIEREKQAERDEQAVKDEQEAPNDGDDGQSSTSSHWWRNIRNVCASTAQIGLVLVPVGLTIHLWSEFVMTIVPTTGPSMVPTLDVDGNAVLISRWNRRGRAIAVGDVVAFRHPLAIDTGMIKRVIGMPGDFVVVGSGPTSTPPSTLQIQDNATVHPFGLEMDEREMMMQVPPGHCYVVGDNLPWSRDSRMFGPIPLALVTGKVRARVWPLWKTCWIENNVRDIQSTATGTR